MTTTPTPEEHKKMIEDYLEERPHYVTYAEGLKRVLGNACEVSIPEAIPQARAKEVSSFSEKCVRKFPKYGLEPLKKMTDLCGGRVIVHTLEQVRAVRLFIEANFVIVEREDKGQGLGEATFGYRDMHYLVRLHPDRAASIGFSVEECETIGQRIAEVQVRSVVQHAWADILHDRLYKSPLRLSSEAKRTGALLAAIMEDGDRSFNSLALEIDGMTANYSAYATRADVEKEISVLELILEDETEESEKPGLALRLARLHGSCGAYDLTVECLDDYCDIQDAIRDELLLELGHALCRVHRETPTSAEYRRGQDYLRKVKRHCRVPDLSVVPNISKQKSLLAKACSRLAWSHEVPDTDAGEARKNYRKALETEPGNPYHLANQLGFEIFCDRNNSMIQSMIVTLRQALGTCREHAEAGTEIPYALFTAGRLALLLEDAEQAIGWYARGLRHFFYGEACVAPSFLDDELNWIERIHFANTETTEEHEWIGRLIALARSFGNKTNAKASGAQKERQPVLIVAGGAASLDNEDALARVEPLLTRALENCHGKVISGGTGVGIPGLVGKIAKTLSEDGKKHFSLTGYIPKYLPADAPKDSNYDAFVVDKGERSFSPGQVLQTWEDLLAQGHAPEQVTLLGFGGGALSAVEYHVALALGATVGLVQETGGAADALLADPVWKGVPTLFALPFDAASTQALTTVPSRDYDSDTLEKMAEAFHDKYLAENGNRLPNNMKTWDALPDTYRTANLKQAGYVVEILHAAGFKVEPASGDPEIFGEFSQDDIATMAELEHGRWNIERLRDGWRPGKPRDDENKVHDCLVPWKDLPDHIKQYDRWGVEAFPKVLAKAGLRVSR